MSAPRWARAPLALTAAAVLLAAGGVATVRASSDPVLPPVPADRLVASVLRAVADRRPISGLVDVHVDLGLPQPVTGALAERAGGVALLLGDHRLRVWRSPGGQRISDLLPSGERSLYVSTATGQAWGWDSESFTAYRLGAVPIDEPASPVLLDPLGLARRILDAISPTTRVDVEGAARVAGRPAYRLVLEARTPGSLVGRVEVAVDAATRLPLLVAVDPRGDDRPALSAAFASVSFGPIDPSVYRFTPPPGAVVKGVRAAGPVPGTLPVGPGGPGPDHIRTFGRGWATVVALRLPPDALRAAERSGLDPRTVLPMSGTLFSARLAERGDHAWLLFGAVPQAALIRAEGRLP